MNILYLCDEYPPGRHGGIGTSVQVLARQMAKLGHTVVVAGFCDWGYGGASEFSDMGVTVFRFRRGLDSKWFRNKHSLRVRGTYKLFNLLGIFQWDISRSLKRYLVFLDDVIQRYNIEIVEAPDFNEYVQYCKKYTPFPKLRVPTVIKLNGSLTYFMDEARKPLPAFMRAIDKNTLQQAELVVSVSNYTAEKTKIYLNYKNEIPVVHNGIDSIAIPNLTKQSQLVIFTGSLVLKKGIFQLMRTWNLVHEQLPDAKLWVLGKGNINATQHYLAKPAITSVIFKGHVTREQLLRDIATASIAIFPSYAEAFALAPLEAMSVGTAVINTSMASGPEVIEDGVDGLLVDPNDIADMADKIMYLLRNKDVAQNLADKAKLSVKNKFDIKVIAAQNLDMYGKVLMRNK